MKLDPAKFRRAWTGGDTPPPGLRRRNAIFRGLVSYFFQEQLVECGGLDFWKCGRCIDCAGTSSMERARIFWNRALLDAWATFREHPNYQ